ncbi:anion/proton exchange transporter Gef1p [Trichomonascus vanleenenianus]|uniref:Gef1p n=1 Tax=Trichomonascus vanleenenianus TaxID=2268995 RepID=UPI003ECA757F
MLQGQLESVPDEEIREIKRYKDFETIDWVEDAERENRIKRRDLLRLQNSSKSKYHFTRIYHSAQGWLVLALMGVCIGCLAAFLNIVSEWLADIKNGHCTLGFYLNKDFCCAERESCPEWKEWSGFGPFNYLAYVLFSVIFAFISAFVVFSFAPYAAGSGISEIKCIVGGFVMHGFLGFKTLMVKSITLPLAISSGLSVGKEGPSVHYAVCVGNVIASQFSRFKHHNGKIREILCACAAAGVAVAFGSPMGGVMFAIEEIASSFQLKMLWRSYFCALVSVGVMAAVNPFRTGEIVLFSVKYDRDWHYFEIIPFIVLGVFGGVYGIFTSKWNLRAQAFRKKYISKYAVEEATFLAAITALICYFNQFLRVDMTESMQRLFRECENNDDELCDKPSITLCVSLLMAVVIRTVGVIVSYGSKVPSGIFVPSMAIGALFGRFVGTVTEAIYESNPDAWLFSTCPMASDGPCITPGTYAFLGAGAALAGIMDMTVTVVVIMFELTGAIRYILPTMIVVGVTKIIGDNWGKGGIADQAIWANGFPYLEHAEHFYNVDVYEAMTSENLASLQEETTIEQVRAAIEQPVSGYPIVDAENNIVGYVISEDLAYLLDQYSTDEEEPIPQDEPLSFIEGPFSRIVNKTPITAHLHMPLEQVVEMFKTLGPRAILVEFEGKLKGLITRKDVLKYRFRSSPLSKDADDEWLWNAMVDTGGRLRDRLVSG